MMLVGLYITCVSGWLLLTETINLLEFSGFVLGIYLIIKYYSVFSKYRKEN